MVEVMPKRERSSSPILLEPKKTGAFFVEMPPACRRTSPAYHVARKRWTKEEFRKLNEKGIKVANFFLREDGLAIDWESPVPIWPDTFLPADLPEPSTINLIDNDAQMKDEAQALLDEEESRRASELEDMSVDFLKRYAETFDTDRKDLASAYASDASFSYCIHDIVSLNSLAAAFTNPGEVQRFAPRKGSRNLTKKQTSVNLQKGRDEIVSALLTLGSHKFCSHSPTDVEWNTLALNLGKRPLVFLTCSGYLAEERAGREHRLSFDQSFILQRPESSDVERSSCGLWPIVAVCHQLTLRDMSLIPSND